MQPSVDDLSKIRLDTAVLTERTEQIDKRFGNINNIFIVYSSLIGVLLAFAVYGIFSTRSEAIATTEKVGTLNATVTQHTSTLDQMKTDVAAIRSSLGQETISNIRNASVEVQQASQILQEASKGIVSNTMEFNTALRGFSEILTTDFVGESKTIQAIQVRMDDMSATIEDIKKSLDELKRQ